MVIITTWKEKYCWAGNLEIYKCLTIRANDFFLSVYALKQQVIRDCEIIGKKCTWETLQKMSLVALRTKTTVHEQLINKMNKCNHTKRSLIKNWIFSNACEFRDITFFLSICV